MHPLMKYILWLLLLYVAYCGLLYFFQRQILFPRKMVLQPLESDQQIAGLQKFWLNTGFGKVEAWFLPPTSGLPAGPAPVVIFGHGNGEIIDFWPLKLEGFTRLGIALLLVEYPGYGSSAGSPSQDSIVQTFVAAYDDLVSRKDIDSSRIIFFGRSLGGGAVCALAQRRSSAALILMSTFTSVRSFAKQFLLPSFLVRDPFDNLSVIKNYSGPVLILHGRSDEVIPFTHGQKLHKSVQNGKMIAYEAGHNDFPPDWKIFWRDVAGFLHDIGLIQSD
jgi:fermentation-respiration switch protein FrsA (DUF1100 family)